MNCLADSKLKALYLGGDIFDMYWCHGHGAKDPRVFSTLERENKEVNKFLDQIDSTWKNIPKRFIEGNHETRFERFVMEKAPALFGITDLKLLIGMNTRPNWTYHAFDPHQRVRIGKTDLYAKHAPKGSSGSTIMNYNVCNLLFGHVHRRIQETRVAADGRILRIMSPGWLGEGRNRVFNYVAGHQNWQQGFARIWVDTVSGKWTVEMIEILDNRFCIANGKRYAG